MKNNKTTLLSFILFFMLAMTMSLVPDFFLVAYATPNSYYPLVTLELERDIYIQNIDTSISISGIALESEFVSYSSVTITLYRDSNDTQVFTDTATVTGGVWSYNRNFGLLSPDIYYIVVSVDGHHSTSYFTYVPTENWTSVSFPLQTTWKGITYTLFTNRTLLCEREGDWISFTFPSFNSFTGISETYTKNSMVFRDHITRLGVIDADLAFVLSHKGLKFYLRGTQNIPRTITVQIDSSRPMVRRLDTIYVGSLGFDFGDLRKSGITFSYSNGQLMINAGTTFFLDPAIFSDGFESNDFSAWDGAAGSGESTISIISTDVHHGLYAAELVNVAPHDVSCWTQFSPSNSTFARMYVTFTKLPVADFTTANGAFFRGDWGYSGGFDIRRTGGVLQWGIGSWNSTASTVWNTTTTLNANQSYQVEIQRNIDDDFVKVWIDGVYIGNNTVYGNLVSSNEYLYVNINSWNITIVVDCVTIDSVYIGADNEAPTISSVTISNMDDTDNLYSQLRAYNFLATFNDTEGVSDLDFGQIAFYDGAVWCNVTVDLQSNVGTQTSGSTVFTLGSITNTTAGTGGTWTVPVTLDWDISEASDIEVYAWANDTINAGAVWTLKQTDYFDIENDLVATFSIDDDRGSLSQSITASGTVTYEGSALYPADGEFTSVSVYDSANNNEGTDSTIVNGVWSITFNAPAIAGIDTYNLYINMSDADYTDAEYTTATDTFIADNVVVVTKGVTDSRTNINEYEQYYWTFRSEYDNAVIQTGTISLNGSLSLTYVVSNARWEYNITKSSVQKYVLYPTTISWTTYGVTSLSSQTSNTTSIIWDRIKLLSFSSSTDSVSVGLPIVFSVTAELEYDSHSLGLGDTITVASGSVTSVLTWSAEANAFTGEITSATAKSLTFDTFSSGSEATYGITSGTMNSLSVEVAWTAVDSGGVSGSGGGGGGGGDVYYIVTITANFPNVTVTIDGSIVGSTPYTSAQLLGQHTISVPQNIHVGGEDYTFDKWDSGLTTSVITTDLQSDYSANAIYRLYVLAPSPTGTSGTALQYGMVGITVVLGLVAFSGTSKKKKVKQAYNEKHPKKDINSKEKKEKRYVN